MTWNQAKILADKMSNADLLQLLKNAKAGITDWTQPSKTNKGFSWGVAWNILAKNFDVNVERSEIFRIQLIRMFSDWLPEEFKPVKKKKSKPLNVTHQAPDFTNWNN